MIDISIIIPAKNEKYLKNTILDVLSKTTSNVEIIPVLDGYWESSEDIVSDKRVKYLHIGKTVGMREAINRGVAISSGKYLLKCDAHVMFKPGFDEVLIKHHKNRRVQVPTRKRLNPETWEIINDGRPDINYLRLNEHFIGRLDDKKNTDPTLAKKRIDEIEAFQGSCWFMRRRYYHSLGLLDSENWGAMGHESQEIYFKVIKAGGQVVRNKDTWYAHWHKERKDLTFKSDRTKSRYYIRKFITDMNKKDYRIKKNFKRRDLAKLFTGTGAEVGVRQGKFSEVICQEGKDVHLLSVDPWDIPYRDKRSNAVGIEKQLEFYEETNIRLMPYDCEIIKKESLVVVADIEYDSLSFVYIDGSHQFDYVMCDIIEWAKRVKPGGIVSGHDYYKFRDADVVTAVDTYCKAHKLDFWLTDEHTPSWWFIKK